MASERSVVVRIKAEYAAYKRDMAAVGKAAQDAARKTEQASQSTAHVKFLRQFHRCFVGYALRGS